MAINLRHLEVFHAIMRAGSMTEAARRLNISQPAVSTILKHAESQLGMKLFQRIGGRLHPTPEAQTLFPDVDGIFARMATLNRTADNLRDGRSGALSIAATTTLAHALLPRAIARFRAGHPDVRLHLDVLPTAQAVRRVAARETDVGVVYAPNHDTDTEQTIFGHSPVVAVMRRDHPLSRRAKIRAADLHDQPLITYAPGTPMGSRIADAFAEGAVPFAPVVEVGASLTACFLANEGACVTLIDRLVLGSAAFPDLVARPFVPAIDVDLALVFARERPRARLSQRFAEILAATMTEGTEGAISLDYGHR